MDADTTAVSALREIERVARTLRYRITKECIGPVALEGYTDAQLASRLLSETTVVVLTTMEPH